VTEKVLDFLTGFDVSETPLNHFSIALDLSEIAAGGELAGTMDAPTVAATHSGSAHHNAVTIGADGEHSLATQVLSGVAASAAQVGHVELATAAEVTAGTDTERAITPSSLPVQIQDSHYVYAADAEASDTYVITLTPAIAAYAVGQVFHFKANTANTGAATLNVNGKGAITIKKLYDQDLATGDIEAGQIVTVVYDGTNFQMQSQLASTPAGGAMATDVLWDALGDLAYASGADAGVKLAGNITTTKKFLRQTGSGAVSAAPAWDTIIAADLPASVVETTDADWVDLTDGGATTLHSHAAVQAPWAIWVPDPMFGIASAYWPANNQAIFLPFTVLTPVTVTTIRVYVGFQANNLDVGIYDESRTRLVSLGSTAVGAIGEQVCNIADTALAAGRYYFAMASNSTGPQFYRCAPITNQYPGRWQYTSSAFPLPAGPVTFAGFQNYGPVATLHISGGIA